MTTERIAIYCAHCGSKDVRRDADACWNEATQTWELVAVYDNASCEQCGGDTTLKETPLPCPTCADGECSVHPRGPG